MSTRPELEELRRFIDGEQLRVRTESALEWLPEQITHYVPSYALGTGGVTLVSIILITHKYLCEVKLGPNRASETDLMIPDSVETLFDIVSKHSIDNYRVATWNQEIKNGDVVLATYEIAKVTLIHGLLGPNFRTDLTYAGLGGRREWLALVRSAIPVEILTKAS